MGTALLDEYSLLHFAVGVIARHWNVTFILFLIAHILFELLENTKQGMYIINNYITAWPGGKSSPDTFLNSQVGDNLSAAVGWWLADALLRNGKN
jgi:hypothetical protein